MDAMRSDDWGGPGKVKNFETVFVDRWGQPIPVAISGSILYDDDGLEIGSIGFAKDIREIRRKRSPGDARRGGGGACATRSTIRSR